MNKKDKKIWRKNFEISNTHFLMAIPAIDDMINYQYITFGRTIIKEIVWVQEDYENLATYMPKDQLRNLIEKSLELVLRNSGKIRKIHKKTLEHNATYLSYSKFLLGKNWLEASNSQIAKSFNKYIKLFMISHGYAIPTTWFIDSDGEDFSKVLLKRIEDIIKAKKVNISVPEAFSVLTTPEKLSFGAQEEIESLNVLRLINNNKKVKKLFLQKDLKKIEIGLENIDIKIKRKIINHYKKWRWLPYTYIGPAYDLDYYLSAWSGLLREKININKQLNISSNQIKETRHKKKEIIKKLRLSEDDKSLFDIAAEIIYTKSFRKDCLYFGLYALEPMLKEIAKRLDLTLKQVRFMNWTEVKPALKKEYFPSDILNKRIKFSIFYQKGKTRVIYHTTKAKKFLGGLDLEKEEIKKVDKISGTVASPGKSRGIVKIINSPEEMNKMEKGNIMVAHTTYPALVPAMKKAKGIVTDDGGVTCHAAIVARELKVPCVVGTKIATRALKDGDKVIVDADKGIVKIIK